MTRGRTCQKTSIKFHGLIWWKFLKSISFKSQVERGSFPLRWLLFVISTSTQSFCAERSSKFTIMNSCSLSLGFRVLGSSSRPVCQKNVLATAMWSSEHPPPFSTGQGIFTESSWLWRFCFTQRIWSTVAMDVSRSTSSVISPAAFYMGVWRPQVDRGHDFSWRGRGLVENWRKCTAARQLSPSIWQFTHLATPRCWCTGCELCGWRYTCPPQAACSWWDNRVGSFYLVWYLCLYSIPGRRVRFMYLSHRERHTFLLVVCLLLSVHRT